MSAYLKSIMIMGVVVPLLIATCIIGGCVMGYSYFQSKATANLKIYKALQQCRQDVDEAEAEAETLDKELAYLHNAKQIDKFVSSIKTSADAEPGVLHCDSTSDGLAERTISLEGLSGPIVPILGDELKRNPIIMTDSWSITKTSDGNALSFTVVANIPFIQERNTNEDIP